MKKLLMTASTFSHIRNFHLPYLERFSQLGWRADVACGGEMEEIPFASRTYALPLEKNFTSAGNFRSSALLRRIMAENGYELVIAHTSLASFFTRLAAARVSPRPKVINVVHGYLFDGSTPFAKGAVLKAAERIAAPWTDLVLTMNGYDAAWAESNHAGRNVLNIPGMGVRREKFIGLGALRTKRSGGGTFKLIYPAEFSRRKNQELLIEAMALLPERIELVLPGDGALLDRCRSLAARRGLAGRVTFPGYMSDLTRLLVQADAAVSSSRSEGLPFNIVEAMLSGLPVAASRVKGHTDLVEDGKTGFLFELGDPAGLAGAVLRLAEDRELAESMGERGREKAMAYTLEPVLPRVMEAYLSVL